MPNMDPSQYHHFMRFLFVTVIVVLLATTLQMWAITNARSTAADARIEIEKVRATQRENTVRLNKNRAATCANTELLGGAFLLGDPCLDPALKPYFQPSE